MLTSSRALTRHAGSRVPFILPRGVRQPTVALLGKRDKSRPWVERERRLFTSGARCFQEAASLDSRVPMLNDLETPSQALERTRSLPLLCPGCGAPSQTIDADTAGYYGSKRVDKATARAAIQHEEDGVYQSVLQSGALTGLLPDTRKQPERSQDVPVVPICDRCHYLLYQSRGTSIMHPSMQSIQDIIEESPHVRNHIYHVVDAADFPMSLIPNLQHALDLPRLRTRNRRSKSIQYVRGRVAEVSFIITRSDLLAPQKEQVDSLVPMLKEILREAMGRRGANIRLGNVRCVSANRGWWTKNVKEDVWQRGGAGWMVGKVNVGKSALYEVIFPKGRNEPDVNISRIRHEERTALTGNASNSNDGVGIYRPLRSSDTIESANLADTPSELGEPDQTGEARLRETSTFQESELQYDESHATQSEEDAYFDEDDNKLLPPAQPETTYPRMPLVSALPGTTASPIRIPFGNGKGELIDLPGIHRSSFDKHIKTEHHKELIMKSRIAAEQHVIKPGQSLLIGGTIRITPKTEDTIFLAYPFVPLEAHVTSNEKAVAIQTGFHTDGEAYEGTVETISTDEAKTRIKSAGTFHLTWDVTKRRSGPLTSRAAGKQKTANLPFIVYSADLLIEGVGWIELVCQVRSRQRSFITETDVDALGERQSRREVPLTPEVEVWSPEGKFVGVRRPIGAWLLNRPKQLPQHKKRLRPRQTISFEKRKAGGAAGNARKLAQEG